MANGKRNIEKQVEDAFIAVLQANTDFGSTVIKASYDGDSEKDYPIVVVHCEATNDPVDPQGIAGMYKCTVTIEPITYSTDDKNKDIIKNLNAVIRDTLSTGSTLLTALKTASKDVILFYAVMNTAKDSNFDTANLNIVTPVYDVRVEYLSV